MAGPVIERSEGYLRTPDGESLWYETAGDGPPLVFSHGLGGNAAVWFQQVPHFAGRYRVVTWDQRGFGRSSNLTGRAGPVTATSDQLLLLDHLGIDTGYLIGQSMGGWAALGAALAVPDRVRALVLSHSTAGIPPIHEPPLDASLIDTPSSARPLGSHPAIGDRLPAIDPARAYLYQALSTFGERPPDGEFAVMLSTTTYDPDVLRGLHVPTLFVAGSLDPLMTPARIHDVAGRLPRTRVVEFESSHSSYFEDPQTWNSVVGEFLREAEGT